MTPRTASPQRRAELVEALRAVENRIERACTAAGRRRDDLTLVVVTKTFPASDVLLLAELGVNDIGESRDQEAADKLARLPDGVRRALRVHFVGQVQTRKSGSIARYADVVHSVDRVKLVGTLSRAAEGAARELDVLVQVGLADDAPGGADDGERSAAHRGGAGSVEALALADRVAAAAGLRLRGVMGIAPLRADADRSFAALAEVASDIRAKHVEATWISAGMSGDLEAAVAHGATHLRVGSAILGSRPVPR